VTHVITQSCCNDASCVPVCPVNCIHPTPDEPGYTTAEMLYIDPEACVDCGECVSACPVDAIRSDNDLRNVDRHWLELNARFFDEPTHRPYSSRPTTASTPHIRTSDRRLRVAIIGSGPAGCYTAERLLACPDVDAEVHVFERLPTPYGLVRFGVAPDHQQTKQVSALFERTAGNTRLHLHLNVEVGKHIDHRELRTHFHAVVYAVGAPGDVKLDIPGETLPGSHSATEFVAWYNGHPDFADRTFDLSGDRAVIVGNGNVSLDVARVLASDVDRLASTDIADYALEELAKSNIKEVVVLGRRGPAQAAFSIAEFMGLRDVAEFEVSVRRDELAVLGPGQLSDGVAPPYLTETARTKAAIVSALPAPRQVSPGKSIELRFFRSPIEIVGDDRVRGLRVRRNELSDDGRVVRPTADVEELECGLVLRSIGYRGKPVPGVPFDETRGILLNEAGRVVESTSRVPVSGVYTTGWIKRGPSGVIGTNRKCAEETVQAVLDDHAAGRLELRLADVEELTTLIAARQPDVLSYADWQAIDRHERLMARDEARPRVKLTSVEQMLAAARAGAPVSAETRAVGHRRL
jgi:ferredoxin/flavodoxin---NADP+ reductase